LTLDKGASIVANAGSRVLEDQKERIGGG